MRTGISPKDFAAAIGVSESSVKRWVDQGTLKAHRTAGGHRRISHEEAIRWLRDQRTPLVRPERLGLPELERDLAGRAEAAERLYTSLFEGRADAARGVVVGLFTSGCSVALIADDVIRPALARIGALWEHGDEGVYLEHRATDICVRVVEELRGLLPDPGPSAPVAVGGAPGGDPYFIAPMLAAVTLVEVGYQVVNLGPNTPLAVLELGAGRLGARLVFISFGVPNHVELAPFCERMGRQGVQVVIGGRFVDRSWVSPGLVVGGSLSELAELARRIRS